jgi:hypothetical protein
MLSLRMRRIMWGFSLSLNGSRRSHWLRGVRCWTCSHSPAEIVGSNPTGRHGCLSWVLCVVRLEVSAMGWSLVQRSPTHRGALSCVI